MLFNRIAEHTKNKKARNLSVADYANTLNKTHSYENTNDIILSARQQLKGEQFPEKEIRHQSTFDGRTQTQETFEPQSTPGRNYVLPSITDTANIKSLTNPRYLSAKNSKSKLIQDFLRSPSNQNNLSI